MFEEMMKYKKAWEEFHNWIEKKYYGIYYTKNKNKFYGDYDTNVHDDFVLSIMPFFFDDHEINIDVYKTIEGKYCYDGNEASVLQKNRKKGLIEACKKAFEILDNKLKGELNENN